MPRRPSVDLTAAPRLKPGTGFWRTLSEDTNGCRPVRRDLAWVGDVEQRSCLYGHLGGGSGEIGLLAEPALVALIALGVGPSSWQSEAVAQRLRLRLRQCLRDRLRRA
jgi:hypothetical protein